MCLIVDANCLSAVFDIDAANHSDFAPVFEWIFNGKGKVVYGGTRYLGELNKYLKIYSELRKAGKAIYVDCDIVDAEETTISKKLKHGDFDDQHLVALLKLSGCKIICSLDRRAYPFFKNKLFFPRSSEKPKIYSSHINSDLLVEKNIADICKPCFDTTKAQKKKLGII
ncbi:hypothetical protein ACFSQ3_03260 [Sphingobacterium corticis]|uniref:PIN domain-containing protein n=1 Tax=Sphingobacterium corticis TaxID=1812823 RepID=A0ABW5NIV2_9SPHI